MHGVEWVDGGGDCAKGEDGEEGDGEAEGVGGEEEDNVVLFDAEAAEAGGGGGDEGLEVREGEAGVAVGIGEGEAGREGGSVAEEEVDGGEMGVGGKGN